MRGAAQPANPCRHCLGLIEPGETRLLLAFRPFDALQPYAESGAIFLHARECPRYEPDGFPDWFAFLEPALVRGYSEAHWILYETGDAVPGGELAARCREILARPEVAYVHVRSRYGCFQCRGDRA